MFKTVLIAGEKSFGASTGKEREAQGVCGSGYGLICCVLYGSEDVFPLVFSVNSGSVM